MDDRYYMPVIRFSFLKCRYFKEKMLTLPTDS
jgi:hypothetical protein